MTTIVCPYCGRTEPPEHVKRCREAVWAEMVQQHDNKPDKPPRIVGLTAWCDKETTMERCETCQYWQERGADGLCARLGICWPLAPNDTISTRRDFGCTRHKPKPKPGGLLETSPKPGSLLDRILIELEIYDGPAVIRRSTDGYIVSVVRGMRLSAEKWHKVKELVIDSTS